MNTPLLKISHKDFKLVVVGPKPNKSSFALSRLGNTCFEPVFFPQLVNAIHIDSNRCFANIEVLTFQYSEPIKVEYLAQDGELNPLPIFFEHIDYAFYLEFESGMGFSIWNESEVLMSGLQTFGEGIIGGTLNFRNNVGESVFFIKQRSVKILKITVLVFSTKLNFFLERAIMMEEIQNMHNRLLVRLFKPTKDLAEKSDDKITGIEWMTIFFNHVDELVKLVLSVERKSHGKLQSIVEHKYLFKLKGSNPHYIRLVNKLGIEAIARERKVLSSRKILTNDTPENRYIKFLLHQVVREGFKWIEYVDKKKNPWTSEVNRSEGFDKVKSKVVELKRILNGPFWMAITNVNRILENRGNFGFHPEFVNTERIARKLKRGMRYDREGTEKIYTLGMEELYEMWAYIKVSKIIKRLTNEDDAEIEFQVSTNEFETLLSKGESSKVQIAEDIAIQTNRIFTPNSNVYRVPLVSQKPDIVMEFMSKGKLILFDAKYRIKVVVTLDGKVETLSYKDLVTKNIEGLEIDILPNDQDIDVIHRYRDAIYLNQDGVPVHAVEAGYILFPGNISNDKLEMSFNSNKRFGIAYLPLTPGEKDEDWAIGSRFSFERDEAAVPPKEDIRAVAEVLFQLLNR